MERFKRFIIVDVIAAVALLLILSLWAGIDFVFIDLGYNVFTAVFIGLFPGIFSLFFPTKKEREEAARKVKEAQKNREEEKRRLEEAQAVEREVQAAKELARTAPGCYSMDNVDLLTFGSQNNIFTAGNNAIRFKIRNRNPYDVIVAVKFKYSDGWESSGTNYEVGGNQIRTVETLGKAWRKASDISIVAVY